MRTPPSGRMTACLGVLALSLSLAACSGEASAAEGRTTLDFFQFKGEATGDFEEIIAGFEAENPDIDVVQNQVADSETAIRTMFVKDRPPDLMTLNGNGSNGQLAAAGVFHDFSGDPVLQRVKPAVQEILDELGHVEGEVNALGYVNNANGIIYNRAIFEEQGIEVPETWDELIAACEKLQAAGIPPFAASLADAWTTNPSWNAISVYTTQDGFFEQMRELGEDVGSDSPVSFQKDLHEPMERQVQLFDYAQDGYRGATYDDANALFADGGAAMMMQGVWALSPVSLINPDLEAGIFPYPVPEDPDERVLVSGVDVMVTMPRDGENQEEALRFIEYMFRPEVQETFAASQNMYPSVEGAEISPEGALQSVAGYVEDGRIVGFIDHQIPPSVPLSGLIQQAMYDEDPSGALAALDNEWRKVAARTIPVTEE